MTALINLALAWQARGYVPLPVRADGSKAPGVAEWKSYQASTPDAVPVERLLAVDTDGLGLLTGTCSGGLEMLELEGRAVRENLAAALAEAMADHGLSELWGRVSGGYVEITPSGGLHYYYRVDGPARGNTRLARRPSNADELAAHPAQRIQVLIETRGEGGFTVIAPSAGRTHPSGKAWVAIVGGMDTIPTLTVDERDALHAVAGVLDQMPARDAPAPTPRPGTVASGSRPGDDYNSRASWADILGTHGWQQVRSFGRDRIGWVRPGKDARAGISATTGGAADGIDRLYVFSSSTEFEPEEPYTKFAALALLEHGGDYAAAARRLVSEGWGAGPAQDADPATSQLDGLIDTTRPRPAATPPAPAAPAASNVIPLHREATATVTSGATALQPAPASGPHELTDAGNADAFAERHAARLRYIPARGQWMEWVGTHWKVCPDTGEATQAARDTIRALPVGTDAARSHRQKSLSRRGIEACVALASRHEALRVDAELLDSDPMVLNTPAGLVDLRDGTLRPSSPDDLCTRITTTPYHPGASAPKWEAFLDETFGGDAEMIRFFQRLVGYSATGAVTHHVLPFAFGPGANGKSVAMDVIVGILGSYASTTPAGFLMAGRADESAIARLAGLRMVVSSEVAQSAKFDEAKVKLLTGGDALTSRFLFGQFFTFTPSHTLWLMGNHQPRVEAGGDSFWRRLRILPFSHTVPVERRIQGLDKQLLRTEGAGILDWIIRGAVDVLASGLSEPDSVMAATRTYADEEDALARFVADRVSLTPGREDTADVRAAYLKWCRAEGEQESSPQVFGRELRARWGVTQIRSNGRRFYQGMLLTSDLDEPDDEPRSLPWDQR